MIKTNTLSIIQEKSTNPIIENAISSSTCIKEKESTIIKKINNTNIQVKSTNPDIEIKIPTTSMNKEKEITVIKTTLAYNIDGNTTNLEIETTKTILINNYSSLINIGTEIELTDTTIESPIT